MSIVLSLLLIGYQQPLQGWSAFENVRFSWEWKDELGAEVQMPTFGSSLLRKEGSELTLIGYYLPLDMENDQMIISQLPFSSCFFCGGDVGPETVAEIHFMDAQQRFYPDQLVTVRGKLHLNPDDFDHLVFMLTDAKVIEE